MQDNKNIEEPPAAVWICPQCGLTFSTQEALRAHIATTHPPVEPTERESWYLLHKAIKEGDKKEGDRLYAEMTEGDRELIANAVRGMMELMPKAKDKAQVVGKQPNLGRVVLGAMGELSDIGYWNKKKNSTYKKASRALDDFAKLERRRVECLEAQKAYERACHYYIETVEILVENLVIKLLTPFQGTAEDPMFWYMTGPELIEFCKSVIFENTGERGEVVEVKTGLHITIPTLRKYQALNLIPKPIRLGRKGYYSLLTVMRLFLISLSKDRGYSLRDTRDRIDECLKTTLESYGDKYPGDRSAFEEACVSMTGLTHKGGERLFSLWERAGKEAKKHYKKNLEKGAN